ncbi:MAG TPA: SBBP repeat-containing protein [Acidobacteriaceae bacterium]|nr:SBBP repeat-containing protein [Acidobacteriaceae bacterium]
MGAGFAALVAALACCAGQAAAQSGKNAEAGRARVAASYARLPLSFEANAGQADARAQFLARGNGYTLALTADGAELSLRTAQGASGALRMEVAGARATAPRGEAQLPGTVSYFLGNDPAEWRAGIPTYARVRYAGIYPGVDLVYYGTERQLEYDFALAPGADAGAIRLRLAGARSVRLAANGDAVIGTEHGAVTLRRPEIYQTVDGRRQRVAGGFVRAGSRTLTFRLGRYDRTRALTIDPVLVYSTFLGGTGSDSANAIAVDAAGDVYVTGVAASTNFPVTSGAYQGTNPGAANQAVATFVTKLNAAGTALVYSTYLGGSGTATAGGDIASAIAVDSAGDAYVTGSAASTNFPVTQGAFQTQNKGAANGVVTGFVTRLNATGTGLVYSTYLGGSGVSADQPFSGDRPHGIAVDAADNAYVTGQTYSDDFPVTQGAFQTQNHGASNGRPNAFVTKLNPSGAALVYSTYLGGSDSAYYGSPLDSGAAIAVDTAGDAYVAGQTPASDFPVTQGAYQTQNNEVGNFAANAFVTELNPAGTALVYSTYLGGSGSDSASGIAVDSAGNAYVTGTTGSTDFPVTTGAFQTVNQGANSPLGVSLTNAFATKLNATGSALVYSTYLGGSGGVVNLSPTLAAAAGDEAAGIAVDSAGDAYVTGSTASANFPVTSGAYQAANADQPPCNNRCIGGDNAFVTEVNPSGSGLVYSTYLGGNGVNPVDFENVIVFGNGDQGFGLALDSARNVYVTGAATSQDFPVTGGAFETQLNSAQNAFIAKLDFSAGSSNEITPTVTVTPSAATITSAQTLTVNVGVNGGSGNPTPTGSVNLSSPGYAPAGETLNAGSVTFDVAEGALEAFECYSAMGFPLPQDLLEANYVPDAASASTYNFASGQGAVTVVGACLTPNPQTETITWAQAQAQATTFSIVASSAPGEPVPTGQATLSTGSYTSPAATLANGTATLSIPAGTFTTGFNIVYANYGGDANYVAVPQVGNSLVTVGGVTVTVTPSAQSIASTQPLTVTVAVNAGSGNPVATGMVTLTSGSYLSATTALTNGTATITIPGGALAVGTDVIQAQYGSGNYAGATGTAQVTVTGSGTGSFTIASSGTLAATQGETVSGQITVTPQNQFTGSVALTAAITSSPQGATSLPTMSFGTTTPVTISGTSAGTATLTVTTTAPSGCTTTARARGEAPWSAAGGAMLAGLLLWGLPARRRRWRAMLGLALLLAAMAGSGMACGSSGGGGCDAESGGTTPGNYVITVTGTSGTQTATGTVNVTVAAQ